MNSYVSYQTSLRFYDAAAWRESWTFGPRSELGSELCKLDSRPCFFEMHYRLPNLFNNFCLLTKHSNPKNNQHMLLSLTASGGVMAGNMELQKLENFLRPRGEIVFL